MGNPFNASTQITGMIGNDLPENRFVGPKGEEYFLQIDPKTGRTEVWNEEWGQDRAVGYYDKDGKFVPNKNWWGGAREEEIKFFNSEEGRKAVNDQEQIVMENEDGRVNQADPPRNLTKEERRNVSNEVQARTVDEEQTKIDNTARDLDKKNKEIAAMGGKGIGRERYGHYCYPITLRRGQQDRLKISVIKFKPKRFTQEEGAWGFGDRNSRMVAQGSRTTVSGVSPTGTLATNFQEVGGGRRGFLGRTSIGSVVLPVNNVNDTNNTEWGEDSMNAAQIAAAEIALIAMRDGLGAMADRTNEIAKDINSDKGREDKKDAIAQYFIQQATGVGGLLARTSGSIINPNMELIFKGPQLRQFGFTYKLSPRDNKETREIKKIIRMFKQSMAPQTTAGNIFLKAPNTYRLEYLSNRDSHSYLPKIKECALTRFDVNYTPNGTYMTYEDSSMIQYEITFAFKELDPIYNNDYTDLDSDTDQSVGY